MKHIAQKASLSLIVIRTIKGNPKKGIAPAVWDIPKDHDFADRDAALALLRSGGLPLGLVYQDKNSVPFEDRVAKAMEKSRPRKVDDLIDSFKV